MAAPFVTFISTTTYKVVSQLVFGTTQLAEQRAA